MAITASSTEMDYFSIRPRAGSCSGMVPPAAPPMTTSAGANANANSNAGVATVTTPSPRPVASPVAAAASAVSVSPRSPMGGVTMTMTMKMPKPVMRMMLPNSKHENQVHMVHSHSSHGHPHRQPQSGPMGYLHTQAPQQPLCSSPSASVPAPTSPGMGIPSLSSSDKGSSASASTTSASPSPSPPPPSFHHQTRQQNSLSSFPARPSNLRSHHSYHNHHIPTHGLAYGHEQHTVCQNITTPSQKHQQPSPVSGQQQQQHPPASSSAPRPGLHRSQTQGLPEYKSSAPFPVSTSSRPSAPTSHNHQQQQQQPQSAHQQQYQHPKPQHQDEQLRLHLQQQPLPNLRLPQRNRSNQGSASASAPSLALGSAAAPAGLGQQQPTKSSSCSNMAPPPPQPPRPPGPPGDNKPGAPGKLALSSLARRRGLAQNLGLCPMPPTDLSLSSHVDQSFFCNLRQSLDIRLPAKQMADNARLEPLRLPEGLASPAGAGESGKSRVSPSGMVTKMASAKRGGDNAAPALDSERLWNILPPWLKWVYSGQDGLRDLKYRFSRVERREVHRLRNSLNYYVKGSNCGQSKCGPGPVAKETHKQVEGGSVCGSDFVTGGNGLRTVIPLHNVSLTAKPRVEIAGFELGTKNRFNNIWTYEHSRVKLPVSESDDGSLAGGAKPATAVATTAAAPSGANNSCAERGRDYIHASQISFCCSPRRYIATQGPTVDTIPDFWTMVWANDIHVLVMLTPEVESRTRKSEPYWMPGTYGRFEIVDGGEAVVPLERDWIDGLAREGVRRLKFDTPSGCVKTRTADAAAGKSAAAPGCTTNVISATGGQFLEQGDYFEGRHDATPISLPLVHGLKKNTASPATSGSSAGASSNLEVSTIVRKLELRCVDARGLGGKAGKQGGRTVYQIHYAGWPDFGSVTRASHLLSLVRLCRLLERFTGGEGGEVRDDRMDVDVDGAEAEAEAPKASQDGASGRKQRRPVLVHCAAGCGRTGTFCNVDTVLDILLAGRVATIGMPEQRAECEQEPRCAHKCSAKPLTAAVASSSSSKSTVPAQGQASGRKTPSWSLPSYTLPLESLADLDPADPSAPVWTSDLVEAVAEHFRTQRMGMIQTYPQFQVCYEAVLEGLVWSVV